MATTQLEGQLIRRIEPLNRVPHDLARQRTMAINRCHQVREEAVTLGDIARDCYGNRTEMMQLKTGLDYGPRLRKSCALPNEVVRCCPWCGRLVENVIAESAARNALSCRLIPTMYVTKGF
jgi:hypothetical protein